MVDHTDDGLLVAEVELLDVKARAVIRVKTRLSVEAYTRACTDGIEFVLLSPDLDTDDLHHFMIRTRGRYFVHKLDLYTTVEEAKDLEAAGHCIYYVGRPKRSAPVRFFRNIFKRFF